MYYIGIEKSLISSAFKRRSPPGKVACHIHIVKLKGPGPRAVVPSLGLRRAIGQRKRINESLTFINYVPFES